MKRGYDKPFFWITVVLVVSGIFILASASLGLLNRTGVSFSNVLIKQISFGIIGGGILALITSKINYNFWKKISVPFFLFSFFLTVLVFVPEIGFEFGGAKRWLSLGLFSFQPAELLKFSFIIYLSSWISSRKNEIPSLKSGLMPFLVIMGFVGGILILQPDIGTLGVIAIASCFMFFIGGGKLNQIAIIIILGLALICLLAFLKPHAMSRIMVFLDPTFDTQGIGYQLNQSLITIGSGGLFGKGFGMSIQKFQYLPEPIGDSIFAVFAEEFGFVGSVILILLFVFFLSRGLFIASRSSDLFARLLASGIVILIAVQTFINIAAMTGLLPLTGLPLAFVSQGGSSLAMALGATGILLNISKYRS